MTVDVHRNGRELTVTASLPGFAANEVEVSVSPDRAAETPPQAQPQHHTAGP